MIDTSCAALLLLAKEVHARGYKVALTGEGADEWLAGYPWFKVASAARLPRRRCRACHSARRPGGVPAADGCAAVPLVGLPAVSKRRSGATTPGSTCTA